VVDLIKTYFPKIIDKDFTANMEGKLDEVEDGSAQWKQIIRDFYDPFIQELAIAEEAIGHVELVDEVSDEICDKCGRNMVIKHGRFGKFLACPGFPSCRNTKPILVSLDVPCPQCGEGKVVVRSTKKKKKFFGCSRYPECDYISWYEPTDQRCPVCGGVLVKRPGRGDTVQLTCSAENCKYSTTEMKPKSEDND